MARIIITVTTLISLMIQFYLTINVEKSIVKVLLISFISFRINQSTFRGVILTFDQLTVEQMETSG